eukprot:CAMPEP_0177621766 /NCGR_PEP_ID=MMETSP0419_2-20121207/27779_1 /TAXON_ID=582737 /ORGANISM="Tetraselmis sp., Strain GSL018" /LENGTH=75 /DNA_ID=CAMNT_0019121743 /DNA_START=279 /DNA_END=506 /DNA_ORIENTATION=+
MKRKDEIARWPPKTSSRIEAFPALSAPTGHPQGADGNRQRGKPTSCAMFQRFNGRNRCGERGEEKKTASGAATEE